MINDIWRNRILTTAAMLFTTGIICAQAQHEEHGTAALAKGSLQSPAAMQAEHHQLHLDLASALKSGGKTAEAARAVEAVLAPHFQEEEKFAMPPLSLLKGLAEAKAGKAGGARVSEDQIKEAITMSDTLRSHYDKMLSEHRQITKQLELLEKAATAEKKADAASFARRLMLHAQHEEQVLYPATLVLGEYLRLRKS